MQQSVLYRLYLNQSLPSNVSNTLEKYSYKYSKIIDPWKYSKVIDQWK